jgi:hypothetical protein
VAFTARHRAICTSRVGFGNRSKRSEGPRRAEADKIAAAQLVDRAQQMMLVGEPALELCDDRHAVIVATDP